MCNSLGCPVSVNQFRLLSFCGHVNDLRLRHRHSNRSSVCFVPNQLQIAYVNKQAGRLSKNKHDVLPVDGIRQQNHCSADTQIPERSRYNAAFFTFAAKPLHDEPRCEQKLPRQTECNPDLFARHKSGPSFQQQELHCGAATTQRRQDQ